MADPKQEEGVAPEPATAPDPEPTREAPPGERRGPRRNKVLEVLRIAWAQLTAMRTALLLLFLLAVAAIPGSLIPQRPTEPMKVRDFVGEFPELARWYEPLGLFDVYGSPWFAAIYLLLFVSLIGCIVPRIKVYTRALRARPTAAPKRLDRLAVSGTGRLPAATADDENGAEPAAAVEAAAAHLRKRRWRVRVDGDSLGAERGYLREAGNLVFHLSLVVLLCGLAWTSLYGFRGTAAIVAGGGFTNTLTQYDELTAGGAFDASQLEPFSLTLDDFTVLFETDDFQRGAPREFTATTTVTTPDGTRTETLQVNHPLSVGGTEVHLLGHGYAPVVTVKDGDGNVAFSGPVIFLPQDQNFSSSGVIKAPDGRPHQLAFEGLFLPTATVDELGPRSLFPDALLPELFLNAWYGEPAASDGTPENVYILDTSKLTQFTTEDGQVLAMRLRPGESMDLPSPGGSISFDGWQHWIKVQVSSTPGTWVTLAAIISSILGLSASLFIRPRRLFLRVTGNRVVAAGLDRADTRTGLDEDVRALIESTGAVALDPLAEEGAGEAEDRSQGLE